MIRSLEIKVDHSGSIVHIHAGHQGDWTGADVTDISNSLSISKAMAVIIILLTWM